MSTNIVPVIASLSYFIYLLKFWIISKETLLAITSLSSFYKCEGLYNFIASIKLIDRKKKAGRVQLSCLLEWVWKISALNEHRKEDHKL